MAKYFLGCPIKAGFRCLGSDFADMSTTNYLLTPSLTHFYNDYLAKAKGRLIDNIWGLTAIKQ